MGDWHLWTVNPLQRISDISSESLHAGGMDTCEALIRVQVTLVQPACLPARNFRGLLQVSQCLMREVIVEQVQRTGIQRHRGGIKHGFHLLTCVIPSDYSKYCQSYQYYTESHTQNLICSKSSLRLACLKAEQPSDPMWLPKDSHKPQLSRNLPS